MAKTNPIGVRFNDYVLERFKKMEINSPQKALNFMEALFMRTTDDLGKIVSEGLVNKQKAAQDSLAASKTVENKKDKETNAEEKDGVETAKNAARIAELEKELKSPPKSPLIGLKAWIVVRQKEIDSLKK